MRAKNLDLKGILCIYDGACYAPYGVLFGESGISTNHQYTQAEPVNYELQITQSNALHYSLI